MSNDLTLDGGPLVESLRRLYTMGGGDEKRQFPGFIPPIQIEAAERITALEDALREAVSMINAIENSDLEFGLPNVDGVNWWYAAGEFQANRTELLGK